MGVFATRSPFRPNNIGLSAVKLEKVEYSTEDGPVLFVRGADLLDGTPIYDIKPYLPYADSIPDAVGGFTEKLPERRLEVVFGEGAGDNLPEEKKQALISVLENDPRPSYQNDPERVYGFSFGGYEISFRVEEKILTVDKTEKIQKQD